jgi:hypothetical protein
MKPMREQLAAIFGGEAPAPPRIMAQLPEYVGVCQCRRGEIRFGWDGDGRTVVERSCGCEAE